MWSWLVAGDSDHISDLPPQWAHVGPGDTNNGIEISSPSILYPHTLDTGREEDCEVKLNWMLRSISPFIVHNIICFNGSCGAAVVK